MNYKKSSIVTIIFKPFKILCVAIAILFFVLLVYYNYIVINNGSNSNSSNNNKNITEYIAKKNNLLNNENTDNSNNSLENRRENVAETLSKNLQAKAKVKNDMSNTFYEVMNIESQIAINNAQISALDEQIKILNMYIADSKNKIKVLEEEKEKRNNIAKKRLKTIYENGSEKNLEVILSSKNIVDFFSNIYMVRQINKLDNNMVDTVNRNVEEIRKMQDVQVGYENSLKEKEQQLLKIRQNNIDYIVLKNAKLQSLTNEEKTIAENIETLEAERLSIEKEIARQSINISPIERYVGGVLAWPVPSCNSTSWITATYGEGWSSGYPGPFHSGVDIAIPHGEVGRHVAVAAQSGRVITAVGDQKGSNRSYGNYLLIDHGGGVYTLYAHADSLLVSIGDYVEKGQPIMYVGSTGNSTGPHLHFEVRIGGSNYANKVDPLPFITNEVSPENYIPQNMQMNNNNNNGENNIITNDNTHGKGNSIVLD